MRAPRTFDAKTALFKNTVKVMKKTVKLRKKSRLPNAYFFGRYFFRPGTPPSVGASLTARKMDCTTASAAATPSEFTGGFA